MRPSETYLHRIEQWIFGGLPLRKMNMSLVQQYRAKLVLDAYHVWMTDHLIDPTTVMRNIAAREYAETLRQAKLGDTEAIADVEAVGIREGVPRSISEISNDVYVLNWMVRRFNTSTRDIDKAKVQTTADWLMKFGKSTRNDRAATNGAKLLMDLNQNFNEKENPKEQMAPTDINITGDISIVKSDRTNLSEDERKRLAKKYGLTPKEVQEMREQEDGTFVPVDDDESNDELSPDYNEQEYGGTEA